MIWLHFEGRMIFFKCLGLYSLGEGSEGFSIVVNSDLGRLFSVGNSDGET